MLFIKRFFFVWLVVLGMSCKKSSTTKNASQNPVPSIPVQLTLYPNDPGNFKIQAIGGWIYVDGIGINGVVIYRKSEQEFVAVERTSSYYPNDARARISVMKDNFTLRDSISGSEWRIFDGTVTKGPAEWPLRLYGSTYDGNVLKVRN